ncbi:MAG: hypothetical protein LBU39_08455 [Desulfobulbaceae bacterium]|jgi:hypothetical protein|nr:hypothetical protein [Desulfobulbaceae bacterium]
MKTETLILIAICAALTGCGGQTLYVDSLGGEHQVDAATARIMAQRDMDEARTMAVSKAMEGATPEGRSLLAMSLVLGRQPVIEREKTWDERFLPYLPFAYLLLGNLGGGMGIGWQNGQSSADVSGDGNVVNVFGRVNGSNIYPGNSASSSEPWTWSRTDTSSSVSADNGARITP